MSNERPPAWKHTEYRVTCDPQCYELASAFLEDHPGFFTHRNADELGGVIQKAIDGWIADAKANHTPETT